MKRLHHFLSASIIALLTSTTSHADVLSVHCPKGCPTSPAENDLIFRHLYVLSNNAKTKFADWVAYEVNPVNFGVSPGRVWKADPLLSDDETLEPADYKGANSSELKADRGHQAPLASFAGSRYWYEFNYLSNITPQHKNLNQGAWVKLESAIRNASRYDKPLYVITGPLYSSNMGKLPNSDEPHIVPSAYYKIVSDNLGNSTSFIMKQSAKKSDSFCGKKVTKAQVQQKVTYTLPLYKDNNKIFELLGCS